jgi:hypothetical protein
MRYENVAIPRRAGLELTVRTVAGLPAGAAVIVRVDDRILQFRTPSAC